MKTGLKTNPEFDNQYCKLKIILENTSTPQELDFIYDVYKRLFNQYGIGIDLVEKIYVFGYIYGIKAERSKHKKIMSHMMKETKLL